MLWFENLLSQATVERLGWMLVHFLWQAAVVAMLLAGFLRLLRRSSANVRYLTACAALVLIVVLPIATMRFVEVPGPAAEAGPEPEPSVTTAPPAMAPVVQMPEETFTLPDVPLETADVTIPVPWDERITSMLEPALPYAVLGWLIGVFGLSTWHLGGWMQLQRLKRRMVHRAGNALQQRLAQIAGRLGVHRAVTLLESALVEVPTVVGWLRPVILLPASALTGLSPEQLEAILAHELAHIRRYDYLVNVLQTVVEILGFYHPAVWWVSHRIRIERENCCDDVAVRLCGDSVRYARALTCLEEMRHSQAELAMAATGGSLLDRIARLLGRPDDDDRRFAWLPGLITLLLVIGVVIPAALALAGANARSPESPADDAAAMIDAPQVVTEPNDPNRAQIQLDFHVAEVFSNAILDQDTAMKLVDLLARIPVNDARRTAVPDAPPSIDELRQPLADVLVKFAPKPGKTRHLMDRLVSKGYAEVILNPRLRVRAGQQASIAIGNMPDPNATQADNRESAFMRLNVTANEVQDQNATRLEIDFVRTYPTYKPDDPNKETTTSAISSTLVAPNNQYTSITDRTIKRVDENGRERLVLAFVQPAIVQSPEAAPSPQAGELSMSEPNGAEADKAYVQVGIRIVKVIDSRELDRETVLKIEQILGKRVRPEGRAGEFGWRFHLTIGEVLRNHVIQQPLPGETMDALLPVLGAAEQHMQVLSCPRVVAREGEESQIKLTSYQYFWMGSSADGSSRQSELQEIEIGTKADLTPRVGDNNDVTLDLRVELSDLLPHSDGADVPVVRRRALAMSATTRSGQYITYPFKAEEDTPVQDKDEESVYVMAMGTIVKSPADDGDANETALGMGGMGGLRESSGEVNTRVFADPVATEQWIQSRMQYVTSDPMYQELARQVAELERELLADGQKLAPSHPQMVQKRALLDALKSRMDERRKSLEQEFEEQIARQSTAPASDNAQRDSKVPEARELAITATFTDADLREVLAEIGRRGRVSIAADETVKPQAITAELAGASAEESLRRILKGTPYVVEKKMDHYEVIRQETPAEPEAGVSKEEQMPPVDRSDSRAWTIMRQWNCPPLLLGLTQQFAKVLQPSRRDDLVWRQVQDGGTLRVRLDVEGDVRGEVLVGLFKDARWLNEPVAVRRLSGTGTHTLTGLPAGRYQIGAIIGNVPVPLALGVHRTWPEAIEIGPNYTATADVLVSEAFQKWASGWYNKEVSKDYLGQWADLDETNLLQGQLTGPDGKPIRFGEIQIRQHNPGAYSYAAPHRGTDEQGIYKFDEMAWPYRVNAVWREAIPSAFGYRSQWVFLSRVHEGPQRLDFRFKPFPEGTAKVAGRVIDQNGQPVKGFFLRVLMPAFGDLDLSNLTGEYKTQVDYDVPFISEEGWFELSGLPAGRATADIIPFEIQRYERERGKDITLEPGKTAGAEFELVGKDVLYGRVLFEDGTPAVITPAPWRGAATRIFMTSGGRGLGVGEVGVDGYFTVYIGDDETQALASGDSRLVVNVPTDQEGRWDTAGEFPYEKLAEDKGKAGVVTIKRPLPTPTLPPRLRQGGPLPEGWRLGFHELGNLATQRTTHAIVYTYRSTASDSQTNPTPNDEQFELYGPDGRCAVEFNLGSVFLLDKAQSYTLIARRAGDKPPYRRQITRGPFALDLSRPGQYTLIVDLSNVLLDTRIVAMEKRDMQNLGIEWTLKNTDHIRQDGISDLSIPAGRLFDRVSSDLLMAELDRLEQDSQLDIIASPQVRAREGHESRLQVFMSPHPVGRDDSDGPFDILVTPSVAENNDISLEFAYDVTRGTSLARDANHQAVRPDRPRNRILVHDGGTVALAIAEMTRPELSTSRAAMTSSFSWPRSHLGIRNEDDFERVIMVFIKASLMRDPVIE